ncbi:hypothetical protein L7F22_011294 [Adiantum nelumboides]|nr:hypothetical protein [Adiantum nelumboides]
MAILTRTLNSGITQMVDNDKPAMAKSAAVVQQHYRRLQSKQKQKALLPLSSKPSLFPITSQSLDDMELNMGPFFKRWGEPTCGFYMRTGHYGYGMNCRYNLPPNKNLAAALARDKGEYSERARQPKCQYYIETRDYKCGRLQGTLMEISTGGRSYADRVSLSKSQLLCRQMQSL